MFKFIKDAMTEFEHVVWPTPNENKKYMVYTIGVIVVVSIFLSILWYGIRESLGTIRDTFPHTPIPTTTVSGEDDLATQEELDALLNTIEAKNAASSGTTDSGAIMIDTPVTPGTGAAQ
jgi:preprotein translocase SecE subunit